MAQTAKNPPAIQETGVWSLGWEDPLEKEWLPTPIFLPGIFHWQRSLVGYSSWCHGVTESDMTEWLTLSLSFNTWKQPRCPLMDEWINIWKYINNGILLSHKKNIFVCSNMDEPRDYHTKWSKPKTNIIWYLLTCCHLGISDSATLWTVVSLRDSLSMGFFRQEYWRELACPASVILLIRGNLKKKIWINWFVKWKQTHRRRKQIYGCQREKVGGRDKLEIWY